MNVAIAKIGKTAFGDIIGAGSAAGYSSDSSEVECPSTVQTVHPLHYFMCMAAVESLDIAANGGIAEVMIEKTFRRRESQLSRLLTVARDGIG